MTVRPILFCGPMVRALLAGTKTQTRRVLKPSKWAAKYPVLNPTAIAIHPWLVRLYQRRSDELPGGYRIVERR